jgi:cobalt-zinc-cadmium efflux system outer membrane protein
LRVFRWKGCALLLVLSLAATAQNAPLTFDQVVEHAMQRSPIMGAQHASQRASEGLIQQAGASPNPTLQFQSQTDAFERLSLIGLAVSQPIELGHKRQSRLRVAESHQQEAYWETEVRRRTLRRELQQRFARVLLAQAKQQLAEELVQTTGRHLEISKGRLRAGDASGVEVQALEIESDRRRTAKILVDGELRTALASLGEHLFGPEDPLAYGVAGQLGWRHPLPPLEILTERADQASLQLAQARVHTGENQVTLERSKGVSDLTVQAGVFLQRDYFPGTSFQPQGVISELDDSGPILQLQLQIPLPFNDDNSGNIAAAQARLERSRLESEALNHKLRAELAGLYHTLAAQAEARDMLESRVLPASRLTLETVEKAYALGFRSQVDLLLAREAYLRAAEDAVQAAFDESLTLADLEAVLGHPLPTETDTHE